jgi:hypothetical protein
MQTGHLDNKKCKCKMLVMTNKNDRQHMQERKILQNPFIYPLEWRITCLNGRKLSTQEWQHVKCNIYTNIQTMWLHDSPAPNWPLPHCRMAPSTSQSCSTKTTHHRNYHELPWRQELSLTFFSLSTAECSLKTHTYSFPAFCWDLASRVAFSMHTIRHPVHNPLSL